MTSPRSRYEVIRVLGTGGMAEVCLARLSGPSGFEKQVVLKRLLPHLTLNRELVALFEREARLSAHLDHPNLVQILDFGSEDGRAYLVMEFVDGGSLRELLRGLRRLDEHGDLRLVAKVFSLAAQGLAAAHSAVDARTGAPLHLVHRDVSPDNILLSRAGAVKVSDFGVARAMVEASTTAPDVVRGKLAYLSPEQLHGLEVSAAADQWALGVALYEALVGERPFDGPTEGATMYAIASHQCAPLKSRRAECPDALAAIVERCLARDPSERWPDCHELALALDRFVQAAGGPITASMLGAWVDRVLAPEVAAARPFSPEPPEPPAAPAAVPAHLAARFASPGSALAAGAEQPLPSGWPPGPAAPFANGPASPPADAGRPDLAPGAAASPARRPGPAPAPDAAPGAHAGSAPVSAAPASAGQGGPPLPALSARRSRRLGVGVVLVAAALAVGAAARPAVLAALIPEASLVITGRPAGAAVAIDGATVGVTPWAGDLAGGLAHQVQVSLPGFAPWTVSLDAGVSGRFEVQLRRRRPGERE